MGRDAGIWFGDRQPHKPSCQCYPCEGRRKSQAEAAEVAARKAKLQARKERDDAVKNKCRGQAIFVAGLLGYPPIIISAGYWMELSAVSRFQTPDGYRHDYSFLPLGPLAGWVFPIGIVMFLISVYLDSERHYERSRRADTRRRLNTLKQKTAAEGKKYAKDRKQP